MSGLALLRTLDAAVGLIVIAAGVFSLQFGRVARLMVLVGVTWLVGSIVGPAVLLHRGPLVHLHLTYPTGHSRRRYVPGVVTAAYVLGLVEVFVPTGLLTLPLALVVAAAAIDLFVRTSGPARKAGRPALWAALGFSAVLVVSALNQLATWNIDIAVLLAYDAVVAGAVTALAADLRWGRWTESTLSDLVTDLGGTSDTFGLDGRLRQALGDPGLTVGYWDPARAVYTDEGGRAIELPAADGSRAATLIDDEDRPVAVLVHDRALLEDPRLVSGVATAARLAMTNAQMLTEIRSRVVELGRSHDRMVEAADRQRTVVAEQLGIGAQGRLTRVAGLLDQVAAADLPDHRNLDLVRAEVVLAQEELATFVRGFRPSALVEGGLDAALRDMARHFPFTVDVHVEVGRLPDALEGALLFFCSEAVTNVAKHAGAQRCRVSIGNEPGLVVAVVEDDGVGGADTSGSGLLGLADRIETMGGRLVATSPDGAGTRLEAHLPLTR